MMVTWAGSYVVTDTKVANYQALNGDMVVVDMTGGPLTVFAPLLPEDSAAFGVRVVHNPNLEELTISVAGGLVEQPTVNQDSATAIVQRVNIGTVYFGYDGIEWRILSQERMFSPRVFNQVMAAPVAATGAWVNVGLDITLPGDAVYDFRLFMLEEINALGNQSVQFATRFTVGGVPVGVGQEFTVAAAAGVYKNTHQVGLVANALAGVHGVELMMISPGMMSLLPNTLFQVHGPLETVFL